MGEDMSPEQYLRDVLGWSEEEIDGAPEDMRIWAVGLHRSDSDTRKKAEECIAAARRMLDASGENQHMALYLGRERSDLEDAVARLADCLPEDDWLHGPSVLDGMKTLLASMKELDRRLDSRASSDWGN